MSKKLASLEVIAPSIEEAVSKGLAEFGLTEEAVDVEVLDAGSRGLFGLGFRQARVRLTIRPTSVVGQQSSAAQFPVDSTVKELAREDKSLLIEEEEATPIVSKPVSLSATELVSGVTLEQGVIAAREEEGLLLRVARETVESLLEKMKVHAQVTAHIGEPDDVHSRTPLLVEVLGDDLSILIGPKAETLNALQYIAGLIIGKEVGRTVPLVVDVEGYRVRRAQQIRYLARRMAEQAVKTGHRQVLESMPSNERRLVHIELRNHPHVTTESIGEEPHRKVTILPK